ncbi:MAG TPA: glycerate kinase [Casimicrobiaceae bacterium]|nr:glycerate kinase [Casimicrobiaceae bacterium]
MPPVVVVAPDSFKGSLDAPGVCDAIAAGLRRVWPQARIVAKPIADGGEGTLDAVLAAVGAGGRRMHERVQGAAGDPLDAPWGLLERDGAPTAVIEIAAVVGITERDGMRADVEQRSTRGVGELVARLLDHGLRRFMIGLGGSSTNDGGAGLLAALGLALRDAQGREVAATPAGLATLATIDAAGLDPRLRDASVTIMSDVNNPLCGTRGATAIFGPQKGVASGDVARIDGVLARFAALAAGAVGRTVADAPGAGAAGGLGFALQLVGGRFASGAEVIADLVGLDAALDGADWAITGEGRSDAQTLLGKAPLVVARHAQRAGVPVSLLSGALAADALPAFRGTFAGAFALPPQPATLDECIASTAGWLADRAEQLARLVDAAGR